MHNFGVGNVGSHANANAGTSGGGGYSSILEIHNQRLVTAFGHAAFITTITLQFSQDGTNFYDGPYVAVNNADFYLTAEAGCVYVRLKSSGTGIVTATLAAKA